MWFVVANSAENEFIGEALSRGGQPRKPKIFDLHPPPVQQDHKTISDRMTTIFFRTTPLLTLWFPWRQNAKTEMIHNMYM